MQNFRVYISDNPSTNFTKLHNNGDEYSDELCHWYQNYDVINELLWGTVLYLPCGRFVKCMQLVVNHSNGFLRNKIFKSLINNVNYFYNWI